MSDSRQQASEDVVSQLIRRYDDFQAYTDGHRRWRYAQVGSDWC
jgi:hypothetical protein